MITTCFNIIFPFTTEIYSTTLRATGLGFNNAFCRVGGILMPWVLGSFFLIKDTGPFLAFFIFSLISSIAAYLIP
jgi:hypothetical protein